MRPIGHESKLFGIKAFWPLAYRRNLDYPGLMLRELTTTAEVMDALGGTHAVAAMTCRKYGTAWNWRGFDTFPPDTYVVMKEALAAKELTAPSSLWRMVEGNPLSPDTAPAQETVGAGS
jgi:hypothetical protein